MSNSINSNFESAVWFFSEAYSYSKKVTFEVAKAKIEPIVKKIFEENSKAKEPNSKNDAVAELRNQIIVPKDFKLEKQFLERAIKSFDISVHFFDISVVNAIEYMLFDLMYDLNERILSVNQELLPINSHIIGHLVRKLEDLMYAESAKSKVLFYNEFLAGLGPEILLHPIAIELKIEEKTKIAKFIFSNDYFYFNSISEITFSSDLKDKKKLNDTVKQARIAKYLWRRACFNLVQLSDPILRLVNHFLDNNIAPSVKEMLLNIRQNLNKLKDAFIEHRNADDSFNECLRLMKSSIIGRKQKSDLFFKKKDYFNHLNKILAALEVIIADFRNIDNFNMLMSKGEKTSFLFNVNGIDSENISDMILAYEARAPFIYQKAVKILNNFAAVFNEHKKGAEDNLLIINKKNLHECTIGKLFELVIFLQNQIDTEKTTFMQLVSHANSGGSVSFTSKKLTIKKFKQPAPPETNNQTYHPNCDKPLFFLNSAFVSLKIVRKFAENIFSFTEKHMSVGLEDIDNLDVLSWLDDEEELVVSRFAPTKPKETQEKEGAADKEKDKIVVMATASLATSSHIVSATAATASPFTATVKDSPPGISSEMLSKEDSSFDCFSKLARTMHLKYQLDGKTSATYKAQAALRIRDAAYFWEVLGVSVELLKVTQQAGTAPLHPILFSCLRSTAIAVEQSLSSELVFAKKEAFLLHSHVQLADSLDLLKHFPSDYKKEAQQFLQFIDYLGVHHRYPKEARVNSKAAVQWLQNPTTCKVDDLKNFVIQAAKFMEMTTNAESDQKSKHQLSKAIEKDINGSKKAIKAVPHPRSQILEKMLDPIKKDISLLLLKMKEKIDHCDANKTDELTAWGQASYHLEWLQYSLTTWHKHPNARFMPLYVDVILTHLQILDEQMESALYIQQNNKPTKDHNLLAYREARKHKESEEHEQILRDLNIGSFAQFPRRLAFILEERGVKQLPKGLQLRFDALEISRYGDQIDDGMTVVIGKQKVNLSVESLNESLIKFIKAVLAMVKTRVEDFHVSE